MDSFSALVARVVTALESAASLYGFAVRHAFAGAVRETPLEGDVVVVSLAQAQGRSGALHDLIGQPDEAGAAAEQYYGRLFDVTMQLRIITPAERGGQRCTQLFALVADALLLGELPGMDISAVRAYELAYDRELRAFVLPLEVDTKVYVMHARDGEVFEDIVIGRVG